MVSIGFLIHFISILFHLSKALIAEQINESLLISVPMQSVLLPCKAVLSFVEPERVMWYKLTPSGPSSLSVGKHLITKDSRFSVAHYSIDHGVSPARWDLHINQIQLSDAADYQCHSVFKATGQSSRSTVRLIIQDILVEIQPIDIRISPGESAQFSCSFYGQQRVEHEKLRWFQDGQVISPDSTRVITTVQLTNMTLTTLQILEGHSSDSGSYRCSDGHYAQSREAKLFIRDLYEPRTFFSLSSSMSFFSSLSLFERVFCLFFQLQTMLD